VSEAMGTLGAKASTRAQDGKRRGRRKMSAAQKRAVGLRMKAYRAKRRAAKGSKYRPLSGVNISHRHGGLSCSELRPEYRFRIVANGRNANEVVGIVIADAPARTDTGILCRDGLYQAISQPGA
jgi:hypothetical protein